MRFRRLAAALLPPILGAAALGLTAVPVSAAIYVGPCPGNVQVDQTYAQRQFASGAGLTGVTMDVRVRTLRGCTSPSSSAYDYPAVVLSLQRNITTDPADHDIVQLAYVICNKPGGCPGGVPNDGNLHWVYTRGDNTQEAWLFDTYYHAPVLGREYALRITNYHTTGGDDVWQYCIRDKASEPDYTCHTGGHQVSPGVFANSRSWNIGRWAWWGVETQNRNSQQGTGGFEPLLDQRVLKYNRSGTWWISEDLGCYAISSGARPSYYGCTIQSTVDVDGDGLLNDNETIQIYTFDRT